MRGPKHEDLQENVEDRKLVVGESLKGPIKSRDEVETSQLHYG